MARAWQRHGGRHGRRPRAVHDDPRPPRVRAVAAQRAPARVDDVQPHEVAAGLQLHRRGQADRHPAAGLHPAEHLSGDGPVAGQPQQDDARADPGDPALAHAQDDLRRRVAGGDLARRQRQPRGDRPRVGHRQRRPERRPAAAQRPRRAAGTGNRRGGEGQRRNGHAGGEHGQPHAAHSRPAAAHPQALQSIARSRRPHPPHQHRGRTDDAPPAGGVARLRLGPGRRIAPAPAGPSYRQQPRIRRAATGRHFATSGPPTGRRGRRAGACASRRRPARSRSSESGGSSPAA